MWKHRLLLLMVLLACPAAAAHAVVVVVPDQYATVQAAVDAGADEVQVRSGTYHESLVVNRYVTVRCAPGTSPANLPVLDAVSFQLNAPFGTARLIGFHVTGAVRLDNLDAERIEITQCQIDSGVPGPACSRNTLLDGCTITGPVTLGPTGEASLNRCTVRGQVYIWANSTSVVDCTLEGPGAMGVQIVYAYSCTIKGNRIRDFALGVSCLNGDPGLTEIAENDIVCGSGISATGPSVTIHDNHVEATTGPAIQAEPGHIELRRNIVLGGMPQAIYVGGRSLTVEANVIGRSHGDGIVFFSFSGPILIRGNTVYSHAGTGMNGQVIGTETTREVSHNIVFGNGGYGIHLAVEPGSVPLSCNDWFGNAAGDIHVVEGSAPSSDLFVDPQFCDVDHDDVHLANGSPLLSAAGCGPIGALGMGCGATSVLVSLVGTEVHAGRVRLTWYATGAGDSRMIVDRRIGNAGWAVAGEATSDGASMFVFDDRGLPGGRYGYRLRIEGADHETSTPVEWVDVPGLSLALDAPTPNPSTGEVLSLAFTLPDDRPATIEVLDVSGRRVTAREVGALGAGSHRLELNPDRRLTAGHYWLRLAQGGNTVTSRFAVTQ